MVTILSHIVARLGGAPALSRALRASGVARFRETWLRRVVLRAHLSRPGDVTVVIGVRDRADYRIVNTLRSIRAQTYPADLIRVVVVDYGSEPSSAELTARVCRQHGAEYVRVHEAPAWSRARCLNVGIRQARTKLLMVSDVDIVLSPRYLADAVRALEASPLAVIGAAMLDLPSESVEAVQDAARSGGDLPLEQWRGWCVPRLGWTRHPSIVLAYTALFQMIRGYDEYYEVWGGEDRDLMRRFRYLGLELRGLDSDSFYLHQWHPKFEGIAGGELAPEIGRNLAYFKRAHSILRNDRDWGTMRRRAAPR